MKKRFIINIFAIVYVALYSLVICSCKSYTAKTAIEILEVYEKDCNIVAYYDDYIIYRDKKK